MAKSKFRSFIKGYDQYSKPVMLTYNNKGVFRTTCGGIATIVTTLFLLAWLCSEFMDLFYGDVSSNTRVITYNSEPARYPTYSLTLDDLLITSRLDSTDPEVQKNIDQYVTVMWMQTSDGSITNYYNPVNCSEIFDDKKDPTVPHYLAA